MAKVRTLVWAPKGSPLQRFISVLRRRFHDLGSSVAENTHWTELPVENMLADGMWPIILKAGERLNVAPNTQTAVQSIANRAGFLINAGLILDFENMNDAVHAWERTVMPDVEERLRNDALSPASVWQTPVATFLAERIRHALETGARTRTLVERRAQENACLSSRNLDFIYVPGYRMESVMPGYRMESVCLLRWDTDESLLADAPWDTLAQLEKNLQSDLKKIALLRKLPINLRELEQEAELQDLMTIESCWFRTMVLKAACQGPHNAYLTQKEYLRALEKLPRLDNDTLVARVLSRIDRTGARLSNSERRGLEAFTRHVIPHVRIMKPKLDLYTIGDIFIHIAERDRVQAMRDEAKAETDNHVIHWATATLEDLRNRLLGGLPESQQTVFLATVAAHTWEMPHETQEDAVRMLLRDVYGDERDRMRFLGQLCKTPIITERPELFLEEDDAMTQVQFARWLPAFVARYMQLDNPPRIDSKWLTNAIHRLSRNRQTALIADPATRPTLAFVDVAPKALSAAVRKVDPDYGLKLSAARDVQRRETIYSDPEATEALVPWGIQEEGTTTTLALIAKRFTEDDIFRWLHEADPDLETIFREFVKNRKRYFKKHSKK